MGLLVKLNNMITAEELLKQDESGVYTEQDITHLMIKFAKLHVIEALKEAKSKCDDMTNSESLGEYVEKSYSLDNIK